MHQASQNVSRSVRRQQSHRLARAVGPDDQRQRLVKLDDRGVFGRERANALDEHLFCFSFFLFSCKEEDRERRKREMVVSMDFFFDAIAFFTRSTLASTKEQKRNLPSRGSTSCSPETAAAGGRRESEEENRREKEKNECLSVCSLKEREREICSREKVRNDERRVRFHFFSFFRLASRRAHRHRRQIKKRVIFKPASAVSTSHSTASFDP